MCGLRLGSLTTAILTTLTRCGFHIYDFARHFHTSCARVLGTGAAEGVTEGNDGIFSHATRRSTAVDAFPIGIDPQIFMDKLQTGPVKDKIIELQRRFDGKKVASRASNPNPSPSPSPHPNPHPHQVRPRLAPPASIRT